MVDGDKALVVTNKTIIDVVERNLKKFDIVPLYYNMKKAQPTEINAESIYNGLIAAFTGGNIGIYSNNISKIWNSEVFISGSLKEQKEAIDIIKILCMENNFVIDYAKTLYKPIRPEEIHEKIVSYTRLNIPYFFKYAKDKKDDQICDKNKSFVNKLNSIIPNPRINYKSLELGEMDYKVLMRNPDIEFDIQFSSNGRLLKDKTDPVIVKYCELSSRYHFQISLDFIDNISPMILKHSQIKQDLLYKYISAEIRTELSKFGHSDAEITDILIKYLYGIKNSSHKVALWLCYGDNIYKNILRNGYKSKLKSVCCVDCGAWFEVNTKDNETCRCDVCKTEYRKKLRKIQNQRAYLKRKNLSSAQ